MARPAERPLITPILMFFLIGWVRCRVLPAYLIERTKIVLLSSMGWTDSDISKALNIHSNTVRKWRIRFISGGPAGLLDSLRSGRPPKYDQEQLKEQILEVERGETPLHCFRRWTIEHLALRLGVSSGIIGRVKRKYGIHTNRTTKWCVSTDPKFPEKSANVIFRYLFAPPNAITIAVDEMTSIQAIERVLGLIVVNGKLLSAEGSRYELHSTINVFVGYDVRSGIVHHKIYGRRRRVEFLDFMDFLVEVIPGANEPDSGIELWIVLDSLNTYKGNANNLRNWYLFTDESGGTYSRPRSSSFLVKDGFPPGLDDFPPGPGRLSSSVRPAFLQVLSGLLQARAVFLQLQARAVFLQLQDRLPPWPGRPTRERIPTFSDRPHSVPRQPSSGSRTGSLRSQGNLPVNRYAG